MNALKYLNGLRPAIPLSIEKSPTKERPATPMSNGELRRLLEQGGVLFNGERCSPQEEIDFPVFSLVFFPNGKRRTTLV